MIYSLLNIRKLRVLRFDWDIAKKDRKKMVEISEELFGKENVAPIATFNTLSTKVAIADVGKVLDQDPNSPYYKQIPYSLRDKVRKQIPTIKTLNDLGEEENKDVLLKELLNSNAFLKKINKQFPLWFKHVMVLEGLPKSMGRHAAGTLITPKPVHYYAPLCLDKNKQQMIQLEMHSAMEELSLIKMDYLGLNNLNIIDDALKLCNLTWDDVDINHLNLDDQEVYNKVYKSGNTIGIFQMESQEATNMLMEVQADNIMDVIAVNAANRPGTKSFFPDYVRNKRDPSQISVIHDDLKEIFKSTHGVMLYQEQCLQIFRYAGFPENEVDQARRAVGHKQMDVMAALEPKLISGLMNRGWTKEQATEMWETLKKQANYQFNCGHATAYGLLSYLTAYLKTHYPVQYMAALLTSYSDDISKMSLVINDCSRMGIKVLPPNINKSGRGFTPIPEKNQILFGLLGVKGIGDSVIDKILEQRPYKGFKDFVERIQDKTAIITLIKAGALPVKNKSKALYNYAKYLNPVKEYTPVKSLPTYKKLLLDYNLDKDDYLLDDGKKVDKKRLLNAYNNIKKKAFDEKQIEKRKKAMNEFYNKYCQDEYLWEFETLSMFLTHDPLKNSYKYIHKHWDDVLQDAECTLLSVIVNIKRKKDKNGHMFAYLDLYTPDGIIEATAWSAQMKEYTDQIIKGNCVAMYGRKNDNHFFLKYLKPYEEWAEEMKERKEIRWK